MKISLRWLNSLLDPGNLTAHDAEQALTFAGFPIESVENLPSGDQCLDVEVTSNRGDVLSHVGVAREIHAATGRALKLSSGPKTAQSDAAGQPGSGVHAAVTLTNAVGPELPASSPFHNACPLFSARVIRGVKIGPSPKWLAERLEAVGQRPINNVVDVTNYLSLEMGQPTHVFDLGRFAKGPNGRPGVLIRHAIKGEKLALLDGRTVTLAGDEIVVADQYLPGIGAPELGSAVSLAGVMGGATTQVTDATVDVLFEAATWAPAAVRRAARRFNLRTDASHRFERIVDARAINAAAQRGCDLLLEVAGGTLEPGVINAPGLDALPPLSVVALRPARVERVLGIHVDERDILRILRALEVAVEVPSASAAHANTAERALRCTIPAHRPDLEREIDLIEEVARIHGLDKLPARETIPVRAKPPQPSEAATRAVATALCGLGFNETVTFTFVSPKAAKPFLATGLELMEVCDERRKADPVLRPSVLASLLACRRANQDSGADAQSGDHVGLADTGVRLFEISSVFGQMPARAKEPGSKEPASKEPGSKPVRGEQVENVNIALVADACFPTGAKALEQKQAAVRLMRGAIEAAVASVAGAGAKVSFIDPPGGFPIAAYDPAARAGVVVRRNETSEPVVLGLVGLLSSSLQSQLGLERPVVMAEIGLAPLQALYPPRTRVRELPAFPAIERDLSLIVREDVTWERLAALVNAAHAERLEHTSFVGTYRGPQAGAGKKSVTLRMRFRDAGKTLRHEEVDGPVAQIAELARKELGATIREA